MNDVNRRLRPAAFLDRDGVINVDHGYVHRWQDFQFMAGAVQAMKALHEAGYLLVVVTNQSGIARGMYTEADFQQLTGQMRQHLAEQGVPLAGVYHCPHHPAGTARPYAIECACRKPRPGLILQAIEQLSIDPEASLLVGDKLSDLEAARNAKLGRAFLIHSAPDTDEARHADEHVSPPNGVYDSLSSCIDALATSWQSAQAASSLYTAKLP